jgi:hypothetical protein
MTRRSLRLCVFLLLVTGVLAPVGHAQELDCTVNINYSQLTGSDFSYLDDLEQRIREYLNTQRWTDDRFLEHERIECSWQILLQQATGLSEFEARLVVATKRPIYGTAQSTPVMRINDESWNFEYRRGTPLVFDLERIDPLTSVLDFYAFLILGFDYDTFSPLGGTPYFEQARRISDRAQSSGAAGWSGLGSDRSRAELVNELLDPRFRPLREAIFEYHLNGLDRFVAETSSARQAALDAVRTIRDVSQDVSRAYTIDLFFSAKYQELTAMFTGASLSSQAYSVLSEVDPAHSSSYQQLTR